MRRSAEVILALPLFLPLLATSTSAQGPTWCGKVYLPNETIVAPTGQFPTPASSTTPLLALRCQPALIPFLPEDSTSAQIIVDALQVYQQWPDAQPYDTTGDGLGANVSVVAMIDGKQVAAGSVALNGTVLLSAPLQGLTPRSEPYNLTCTGTVGSQTFTPSSNLTYLPSPPPNIGSVTKRDLLSGGLKARKSSAQDYELVFPVGFYTTWAGYLEANESTVDTISSDGLNLIHPVPSFDNRTALNVTVAKMEELDIWLMYDMRNTYKDLSAVRSETTPLQSRTNLLLYYTADEPDGTSDPPNATLAAYDLLRDLDPYRPTSLVLNCADYRWTEYASAADILLQDVYNIGNDLSWSSVYNTSCTTEHGVCGCDDCKGGWADISDRVQSFRDRSKIMGWDRTKSVWTVPQGFGSAEFWNVTPTGAEWMAEAIVGINAGAKGVVSWIDPTTADIKSAASTLARAASSLAPHLFLSSPDAKQLTLSDPTYNIGLYFNPSNGSTLVLATSLVDSPVNVSVSDILSQASLFGSNAKVEAQNLQVIMDGGASVKDGNFVFEKMQSGAWVMQSQVSSTNSSSALRTLGLEASVGVVAILVSMVLYFLS